MSILTAPADCPNPAQIVIALLKTFGWDIKKDDKLFQLAQSEHRFASREGVFKVAGGERTIQIASAFTDRQSGLTALVSGHTVLGSERNATGHALRIFQPFDSNGQLQMVRRDWFMTPFGEGALDVRSKFLPHTLAGMCDFEDVVFAREVGGTVKVFTDIEDSSSGLLIKARPGDKIKGYLVGEVERLQGGAFRMILGNSPFLQSGVRPPLGMLYPMRSDLRQVVVADVMAHPGSLFDGVENAAKGITSLANMTVTSYAQTEGLKRVGKGIPRMKGVFYFFQSPSVYTNVLLLGLGCCFGVATLYS